MSDLTDRLDLLVAELGGEVLFIGLDKPEIERLASAIVGYGGQHGSQQVLIYSYSKLIDAFAEMFASWEDDSDEDEGRDPYHAAQEWVDANVACAYHGPGTPIILYDLPE